MTRDEPTDAGNVARRLTAVAAMTPGAIAIAQPNGPPNPSGPRSYALTTFGSLDRRSDAIARGLLRWGVRPGMRLAMLVPFGATFIELTFALLKAGVVPILVDPGMGRKHLIRCLSEAEPDGFVAIPRAQAIRSVLRRRFPQARWNVTVGRRWFWGGKTLQQIESLGNESLGNESLGTTEHAATREKAQSGERASESERKPEGERTCEGERTSEGERKSEGETFAGEFPRIRERDDAAIIFTTGSTGPPKGVLYTHGTFHAQIDRIRDRYEIHPGSRDLACFPLFGLFDAVMGVTTVIPDMDPTRPASVDPRRLIEAANQWEIDQAFGSPALWNTVVRWCDANALGVPFPTLRRVLSAGAPVPATTMAKLRGLIDPDAEIVTPYGATEALPIASIESREVLQETGRAASKGKGVCVGTRFADVRWRVIEIDDGPLPDIGDTRERATGKIGELMVSGPMVTETYVVRGDQNALHKVRDGDRVWHRMGDVGYLDDQDRFWFCGRKAHRVRRGRKTWFTVPCEAVFNEHPDVHRTALVGRGQAGEQTPVIVIEPHPESLPRTADEERRLVEGLRELAVRNPITRQIEDFVVWLRPLPVDIRHNSKIFRERLAAELNA